MTMTKYKRLLLLCYYECGTTLDSLQIPSHLFYLMPLVYKSGTHINLCVCVCFFYATGAKKNLARKSLIIATMPLTITTYYDKQNQRTTNNDKTNTATTTTTTN